MCEIARFLHCFIGKTAKKIGTENFVTPCGKPKMDIEPVNSQPPSLAFGAVRSSFKSSQTCAFWSLSL